MCELHGGEEWEAYCPECDKLLCFDCNIEHSETHKPHGARSFLEIATSLVNDIEQLDPRVSETVKALQQQIELHTAGVDEKMAKVRANIDRIKEFVAARVEKILMSQLQPLMELKQECAKTKDVIADSAGKAKEWKEKVDQIKGFYKRRDFVNLLRCYKEENAWKAAAASHKLAQKDLLEKSELPQRIGLVKLNEDMKGIFLMIGSALERSMDDVPLFNCTICKESETPVEYVACGTCSKQVCKQCALACVGCEQLFCRSCSLKCGACHGTLCSKCAQCCEACKTTVCLKDIRKCEKCGIRVCRDKCVCACKLTVRWYNGASTLVAAGKASWDKQISDCSVPGAFEARFKVKRYVDGGNDYDAILGLEKDTGANTNVTNDGGLNKTKTAYGICFKEWKVLFESGFKEERYGTTVKEGDEIAVTYGKDKDIVFAVNGKSYGVAYRNVDGPFYMFCYHYGEVAIEILSVKSLSNL